MFPNHVNIITLFSFLFHESWHWTLSPFLYTSVFVLIQNGSNHFYLMKMPFAKIKRLLMHQFLYKKYWLYQPFSFILLPFDVVTIVNKCLVQQNVLGSIITKILSFFLKLIWCILTSNTSNNCSLMHHKELSQRFFWSCIDGL